MAIQIVWDTVQDAEVVQSLREQDRIVRTAFVKGLTSSVTTSKKALLDAIGLGPSVPLLGDEFDPAYPNYLCTYRIARGIPGTGGRMARLWIHYETVGGGGAPIERFAADDETTHAIEPTERIPHTLEPMLCSTQEYDIDLDADSQPSHVHVVTSSVAKSYRALVLYGMFADRPPGAVVAADNTVNDAEWQSRPKGYWKCEGVKAHFSSLTGLFSVSVGFLSKGTEEGDDWSQYEFAVDETGRYVKPKKSLMDTLRAQDYAFGMRNNKNGVYKFGPFETSNFSTVFGDSFPIGD